MAGVVAEAGVDVCLVHMKGEPRTMQDDPRYDDVVRDVRGFLEERLEVAVAAGIPEDRVWLDPGIGFGKTLEHNLELIRRLDVIAGIRRPYWPLLILALASSALAMAAYGAVWPSTIRALGSEPPRGLLACFFAGQLAKAITDYLTSAYGAR